MLEVPAHAATTREGSTLVPWERYWVPVGTPPDLDASGFLRDPYYQSEFSPAPVRVANHDARTLPELNDVRCLVLLGEPGAGKTTEIERLVAPGAVRVDLGAIGGEGSFAQTFTHHPALTAWREHGRPLVLLVDAYDEALLRVEVAARLLRAALTDGLPLHLRDERARALRLRITSRSGVWPDSLTAAFHGLWGADHVGVYTLAPLRRQDVALAAGVHDLASDGVLSAIHEAGAGPWAALPLTLFWLLQIYRDRDDAFPATRRELFEQAALHLCHEPNRDRREAGRYGLLAPRQRLVLAARLAALMRFGDRAVLSLDVSSPSLDGALHGVHAEGQEHVAPDAPFTVGPEALRDLAADTGLFRAVGPATYRWTQEAVPDFLAAWYLRHRQTPPAQTLALLTDPDDGRVVPQLVEVAAWAASLDPAVFLALARQDPHVALAGDPQALSDDVRRRGVDFYLQAVDDRHLHTFTDPVPESYRGFRHPDLVDQLSAWLADASRHPDARVEAVHIASQNGLSDLAKPVVDLALSPDTPPDLRVSATYAARWIAPDVERARLLPLALDATAGEDVERLRAAARSVLWPDVLSFSDLIASLALDLARDLDAFSRHVFRDHVFDGDAMALPLLVEALDWVAQDDVAAAPVVASSTIVAACRRSDVPSVGRRLAPLLVRYAARDESRTIHLEYHDVHRALAEVEGSRPDFLDALVDALVTSDVAHVVSRTLHAFWPVRAQDVAHLALRLADAPDDATRDVCTRLLRPLVAPSDPAALQAAWTALHDLVDQSPHVAALAQEAYRAVDLDSSEADALRLYDRPPLPKDPLDPPVPDRLDDALGDPPQKRWRAVCYTLTLRPDSNTHRMGADLDPGLTHLPAWDALDDDRRQRVAREALAFLTSTAPDESDWDAYTTADTWSWRILDGVRALVLLRDRDDPLPDETLTAWAPALILGTRSTTVDEADRHRTLVARAFHAAPDAVRAAIERALPLLRHRVGALDRAVAPLDDAALDRMFLEAAVAGHPDDYDRRTILARLVRRGTPGAAEHIVEQAKLAPDADHAAMWALLHLEATPFDAWPHYAERVQDDDAFARSLLRHIADRSRQTALSPDAPSEALVMLERRLHELFPSEDDPPRPKGVYSPSTADHVRDLRGGFAATLAAQGTDDAVSAVESLHDVLSENALRYHLKRARTRRREVNRRTTAPADFLALVARPSARLARSADELFAVVVETFADFEDWLRAGDAPRIYSLWNRVPRSEALRLAASILRHEGAPATLTDGLARPGRRQSFAFPRDESALADAVLRFLRDRLGPRGILVAREAEVQRGHAPDLLISLPASDSDPAAAVVVEVKASWHDHLYRSLREQLADRYLDGVTRRHGVYLVGWYGPEGWYDVAPGAPHPKAVRARKGGTAHVSERLRREADEATTDTRRLASVVVDTSLPPPRASL